jgi:hypothetical protein
MNFFSNLLPTGLSLGEWYSEPMVRTTKTASSRRQRDGLEGFFYLRLRWRLLEAGFVIPRNDPFTIGFRLIDFQSVRVGVVIELTNQSGGTGRLRRLKHMT